MSEGLPPYPDLRFSGDRWLGPTPSHWVNRRLWTITTPRSERNPGGLPLLSVFLDRGVIRYEEGGGQVHAPSLDLSNYQVVRPGDFVLNNQQAWRGSVGVSRHHGIISPAYIVLGLSDALHPEYANYLLRCPRLVDQYVAASKGVGDIQRQIYWPLLRRVVAPVPPPDEQRAIVRFLDSVCARIDKFVKARKRLIRLVEEQRRTLTCIAVTSGLEAGTPMKDSGLQWIPRVPAHWDLRPNRSYLRLRKKIVGERHSEYRLLSLTKRGVIIRDVSENKGKFSSDMGTSQEVREGDLVFCLFDVAETPRTVGLSRHHGMITSAYTVMECRDREIARFIEAFYIAMDDRKLLSPLYSGLRNTIPKSRFLAMKTPMPPPSERDAILRCVSQISDEYGAVIGGVAKQIAIAREYRNRIITDVVTGQVDVRAAAAALPDVRSGEQVDNESAGPVEPDGEASEAA